MCILMTLDADMYFKISVTYNICVFNSNILFSIYILYEGLLEATYAIWYDERYESLSMAVVRVALSN